MKRIRLDSLLFAIGVHGPSVAFENLQFIRKLYKSYMDERRDFDIDCRFLEVKQALIDAGMEHSAVMEMVLGRHPDDCACWRCVLLLHTQALRHHVRLNQGEG